MINRQDPIYISWNIDSNNNKISIAITNEQHQVTNAQFTLVQLPDYNNKVRFPNDNTMYEINQSQQITNNKQFKVDYNTGMVYVHSDLEADVISVNYYGKGVIKYPATRIYDVIDNVPIDSAKSLQDYINKIKEYEFEDFDPTKVYNPNKIVYYNGSSYVCIQQTLNHEIPSNLAFWRTMTAGFNYRGDYNNETIYTARDMVFYEPEQTIYLCVKASTGNLPTNTEYWVATVSVKDAATYATQQGDYAKGQGDYAKSEGDYSKTERESIVAEYAILKNDFLNATHVEMITVMNDEFIATANNTAGFELALETYNPLIDILQLSYKGIPLYEGDQYVLTGMTVSFLGFTLNTGEKIKIRVEKAVRDTPPVGADGSDIMNGSIGELKLATDVQVKLNRMVIIQDYKFTATVDNTTTFTIASDIFNPITDVLDIYRENLKLTKDTNYSLVGQEVTLFEGLNTNEFVEYRITKNTGNSLPLMPDGSLIQNGTVSIQKLTQEAQNIINTISDTEIEVQNARKSKATLREKIDEIDVNIGSNSTAIGTLASLGTANKTSIVNAINENVASLSTHTTQLTFLDKLKLKFTYGIVGDGSDETAKLRTAINAERNIYIPDNYTIGISSTITITKPTNIYSNGGTLKAVTNGLNMMITFESTKDFVVDGVRFDDDLRGRTILNTGGCTNFTIRNCYFTGYSKQYGYYQTDSAVRINTSKYFTIKDNTFENFGYQYSTGLADLNRCITINDNVCDWFTIDNNIFHNVNQAICSAGQEHQIISNNLFDSVKDNPLYLTAGFKGAVVVGNIFKADYDEPIVIWGGDVIIDSNKFYNTPNKVIAITGDCTNIQITNNIINNNGCPTGSFFAYRDVDYTIDNLKIENNTFTSDNHTEPYPYFYIGNVYNFSIKNNRIIAHTESGQRIFYFDGTIARGEFIGNNITGTDANTRSFEVSSNATNVEILYKDNRLNNGRAVYYPGVVFQNQNAQLNGLSYINDVSRRNILYSGSTPTVNTWNLGDVVYNSNPTANNYMGWVCVTAGTPGVWKGFGLIQA